MISIEPIIDADLSLKTGFGIAVNVINLYFVSNIYRIRSRVVSEFTNASRRREFANSDIACESRRLLGLEFHPPSFLGM